MGMSEFILVAKTEDEADFCRQYSNMKELVRCKDCKNHGNINPNYCINLEQNTDNDWFCADGERKNAK